MDSSRDAKVMIVIPTYGRFDYAASAIATAYHRTPNAEVIVEDDASPDWSESWARTMKWSTMNRLHWHRSSVNEGVTARWNHGLGLARELGAEYVVLANSDLVFFHGWWEGLRAALKKFDVVGPMTNAPGHQRRQHAAGPNRQGLRFFQRPVAVDYVNGFCWAAKTGTWFKHSFSSDHVLDPSKPMVGSEDEFQARLRAAGGAIAYVPGSFVFHYRSVTRGPEFAWDGACRREDQPNWLR